MANRGLANIVYSKITGYVTSGAVNEVGMPIYSGAKALGQAISCKVNAEFDSVELHADDCIAESDHSFVKGTLSLTVNEVDTESSAHVNPFADVLGHYEVQDTAASGQPYVEHRGAEDEAPYVGVGRIVTVQTGGVRKYKAEILLKVRFSEPGKEENTRGEKTEFGTSSLEGTIYPTERVVTTTANSVTTTHTKKEWNCSATFSTFADAQAYITAFFAAPTPASPAPESGE